MNQNIIIRRLEDQEYEHWNKLWELYESSFPHYERRSKAENLMKMQQYDSFFFCAVERELTSMGDFELLGLIGYWQWGDLCFIEHLATLPEFRGEGIGARILELIKKEQRGRTVLLEIDPPMDDISLRRKGFYERVGFVANDMLHIHPSFQKPQHPHRLVLMSYPKLLTTDQFKDFRHFTFNDILG